MSQKLVEYVQSHAAKKRTAEQKLDAEAQALLNGLFAWGEVEGTVGDSTPSPKEIIQILDEVISKTGDYCGGFVFLTAALIVMTILGLVTTHYIPAVIFAGLACLSARKCREYGRMHDTAKRAGNSVAKDAQTLDCTVECKVS